LRGRKRAEREREREREFYKVLEEKERIYKVSHGT
jgi:hypothetical protein